MQFEIQELQFKFEILKFVSFLWEATFNISISFNSRLFSVKKSFPSIHLEISSVDERLSFKFDSKDYKSSRVRDRKFQRTSQIAKISRETMYAHFFSSWLSSYIVLIQFIRKVVLLRLLSLRIDESNMSRSVIEIMSNFNRNFVCRRIN